MMTKNKICSPPSTTFLPQLYTRSLNRPLKIIHTIIVEVQKKKNSVKIQAMNKGKAIAWKVKNLFSIP